MGRFVRDSLLIVDDNEAALQVTSSLFLEEGYNVVPSADPLDAINKMGVINFDAVLSDIKMPGMTGLQLLNKIHAIDPEMPVILMTGYAELDMAIDAVKKDAFDFVTKPYEPAYLVRSIKRAIDIRKHRQFEKNTKDMLETVVKKKTQELADALLQIKCLNTELIQRLVVVSEFRDTDTGSHISRIRLYSQKLAEALGKSTDFAEQLSFASTMHDIGKIAIPDSILLKPGSLTKEEFEIMKKHTILGAQMLAGSSHPFLQMAASIALNHHERWDGTGYPNGLKGSAIPLEDRITMLADVYDALRCKRPYKPTIAHNTACSIIINGDGRTLPTHFDPDVLKAFIKVAPTFEEISEKMSDDATFSQAVCSV
ncbi:MAG TPA: HD domain-containing phosphohydrolase [Nitrospirota bacterium]|nr:HD domain-containing phosphohydrolase [Nitrospirota bacterium]